MARQRTIISIGEALLAEYPGEESGVPAGLALEVARAAAMLGHRGLPISRLGQDLFANELLTQIRTEQNIVAAHLQSDPDLPTGRLIVRTIAGRQRETLDHRAAFDNLQWDFDLVDVAKEADAVVFGMLAQRGAQSSSIITRFLAEATGALIVCDLTNRADNAFDRSLALRSLELAHIAIVDSTAWSILRLGGQDTPQTEAADALMRERDLMAVIWMDSNQPIHLHDPEGNAFAMEFPPKKRQHTLAIVALVHALFRGDNSGAAIKRADRILAHINDDPDEPVPSEMLK